MTTATTQIMNEFERRPTYNELVEMIEEEELKIKPSIENVIDRKATIFRNNQYGGRFDNPDMIGLQKQEQMRQLEMLKRASMTEAMFNDPDRKQDLDHHKQLCQSKQDFKHQFHHFLLHRK